MGLVVRPPGVISASGWLSQATGNHHGHVDCNAYRCGPRLYCHRHGARHQCCRLLLRVISNYLGGTIAKQTAGVRADRVELCMLGV